MTKVYSAIVSSSCASLASPLLLAVVVTIAPSTAAGSITEGQLDLSPSGGRR